MESTFLAVQHSGRLFFSLAAISAFESTSARPCERDRCKEKGGVEANRVVAKSRLARNVVAFAPSRSPPQSFSVPVSRSPEGPGACCQSSDPLCLGGSGAAVLNADDTRYSQELQIERTEQQSPKDIWGKTTWKRFGAENTLPDQRRISRFKKKLLRTCVKSTKYRRVRHAYSLSRSDSENINEFLYVGRRALGQGNRWIPTCSSNMELT